MIYLFNVVVTLVIFYFVWESILAPSLRMSLRNSLFELRDRTRKHELEQGADLDKEAHKILADGIDNYLNRLSLITWATRRKFNKQICNNPSLKKDLERRRQIMRDTSDETLKEYTGEANKILELAFVANHGAWFALIVPLVMALMFFESLYKMCGKLFLLPANSVSVVAGGKRYA